MAVLLAELVVGGSLPVRADPRADVEAVLDTVAPVLPAGVTVAVVPSVAQEMVVTNPTSTVLTVLDRSGQPFLRVDRSGVSANVASPDWYLSNDPEAGTPVPASARYGAPAEWAVATTDDTWAWFDPRVQPPAQLPPALAALPARHAARVTIGNWQVPLRYGTVAEVASGRFVYQPPTGAFRVSADPPPAGVTVSVLQGRLPGLYLTVTGAGVTVTVYGVDGKPFLRVAHTAVSVDPASRSWAIDRQARGIPVTPAPGTTWVRLGAGPGADWLDPRLEYPAPAPPDPARRAVVRRWTVPVDLSSGATVRRTALTGTVEWVPAPATAAGPSSGSAPAPGGGTALAAVAATVAVLGTAGLALAARARSRRRTRG